MKKNLLFVLLFCLIFSISFAENSEPIFKLDLETDGVFFVGAAALNISAYLFEDTDVPLGNATYNLDDVPGFDRWAATSYSKGLDITGDIFQYASALLPAVLLTVPKNNWLTIGVMYVESFAWAFGLKNLAKAFVTRARPFMYFDDYPQEYVDDSDYVNSFCSGHTAIAFNGATFASYVFSKYNPDSVWKLPVIIGSYTLATTTAIFRMASGNHFLSDVLTGALIGSATGFLVPFFHTHHTWKKADNSSEAENTQELSFSPLPNGFMVRYSY